MLKQTKPNKKRALTYIIIVGLLAVIIYFNQGLAARALSFIQRPFLAAGSWFSGATEDLRSRSSLIAENQSLQEKLIALSLYESELETLRDENQNLSLMLGYIQDTEIETVTASVTARSISAQGSLITIDRGEDNGLSVGDPVIVEEGVMIGKIAEANNKSATVRLLSDRNSRVATTILNNDRTLGITEGSGGTLLNFRFIPQNVEINQNDLIVTSGLEENVPSGLLIGIINNVETHPTDPFQEAVIEPTVDYRRYSHVSVIIGEPEL